jgi:hypothetical protein
MSIPTCTIGNIFVPLEVGSLQLYADLLCNRHLTLTLSFTGNRPVTWFNPNIGITGDVTLLEIGNARPDFAIILSHLTAK